VPGSDHWGEEEEASWGRIHTEYGGRLLKERVPTLAGNYPAFYDGIFAAIRNGAPLPVRPEEALQVIRIIRAAYRSSAEVRVVRPD
jgi:scyllo-inositol 2-dehydrogenase (NADP+)